MALYTGTYFAKCSSTFNRGFIPLSYFILGAISDLRGKRMLDIAAVTAQENLPDERKNSKSSGLIGAMYRLIEMISPIYVGSVESNRKIYNLNMQICRRDDPVHKGSLGFIEILNGYPGLRKRNEEAGSFDISYKSRDIIERKRRS